MRLAATIARLVARALIRGTCGCACVLPRVRGAVVAVLFHQLHVYTPCPHKKVPLVFSAATFYKYRTDFRNFSCVTSQENAKARGVRISCHRFVLLLAYRVNFSDTKVTHFTQY